MTEKKMPMGNDRSPIGLVKNNRAHVIKEAIMPQAFYAKELRDTTRKKTGWVCGGLCPLHADNQIGSFRVNLSSGAFKCFSCGARGGDVVAFTMQVHGLSFPEALAKLAKDWGVSC